MAPHQNENLSILPQKATAKKPKAAGMAVCGRQKTGGPEAA
jgi:hypothetical protein